MLFLKHGFDKPLKEACVKEFYVLPFARREEEGTEAEKAVLDEPAFLVQASSEVRIRLDEENGIAELEFEDGDAEDCIREWKGVPRCDILGNSMKLDFPDGDVLEETAYQFYWRTLLPCVAEKNAAADYPVGDGYVVSTLQREVYAGTYPDVDHEFQIKGRIAAGDRFDQGLVKRMLNLQLKLMREDPEGLYRDPCALQPGGVREYHVRRSSMDGETNAVMFLVTGNIEVIESAWLYVAASGDYEWLKENREGLENALSLVIDCMDRYGRLWSDVYYEDQIIKDGRECMSAAMAARAMRLMAQLEELCGEEEKKKDYFELEKKLAGAMTASLPFGFWDTDKKRFADWVDRGSVCHDHIHLLANELPVLFDYATEEQSENVGKLLEEEWEEFQRFPTFLSARIADYTDSELGLPYDLCAAGRYWCWDFAYWLKQGRREVLKNQLLAVCADRKSICGRNRRINRVRLMYHDPVCW